MNKQNTFFYRLINSQFIRYSKLVTHTHGIPFLQSILMFILITVGFSLLHIVLYNVIFYNLSLLIQDVFTNLALITLMIIIIRHTSRVFFHLHNKRNISLFHPLPITQKVKFIVLCGFVYVFQTIVSFLSFVLIAFVINYMYTLASIPNLPLKLYELLDAINIRTIFDYVTVITCFFFGAIYFKSRHMNKTILAMVVGSLLLSFLVAMDLPVLSTMFFYNDEWTADIVISILINGLGIPFTYILMKKHTIAKVK